MNTQETPSQLEEPKKVYLSPVVQIYGTLAQITASIANGSMASDGAQGSNQCTHARA